ncbi:MAG: beta-ketoacyl-ACP synthase II [Roseiflexus sp.]|nr:beta-ketoacyl-ACP synthase II [Roseiflexus sp.]MCS7287801.1 beta-ketoacyl-ACP synthase II [Roseiflexus sp.]MDW8232125.1 beta-ketoacyl-ACP synthase II [Roseiflexaceae bacterium]
MPPVSRDAPSRRAQVRERLLAALAGGAALTDPDTLARKIDQLLADVFEDTPVPQPQPALIDQGDADSRVVVTGMGVVTPLGNDLETFWQGLAEGRSGVGPVTLCDPGDATTTIAAEVRNFDARDYMDAKEARRVSRGTQFAIAAARMALDDAHLTIDDSNRYDIGALIACGSTSPPDTEAAAKILFDRGAARISPFYITSALPNMPSCQVAIHLGLMGYNTTIATACAASAQAIGEAAEIIRRGDATVMLAGGTEAPICRLTLASFGAIRALSTRNHDPAGASRPFDAERDGFVLGEGAGVLVLESLSHARRRGARIYAEIIGYATTCDAYHVTAPHPTGDGAARAIVRALAQAKITPQQVDYINAHATGTPIGDVAETLAIKIAFGEYASSVPISATKSMIGHLTSAAGVVEAAATILAMQHQFIPPTINLTTPDPQCDLDYVPLRGRPAAIRIAISNSFGFGGINSVLVLRRGDLSQ